MRTNILPLPSGRTSPSKTVRVAHAAKALPPTAPNARQQRAAARSRDPYLSAQFWATGQTLTATLARNPRASLLEPQTRLSSNPS